MVEGASGGSTGRISGCFGGFREVHSRRSAGCLSYGAGEMRE